MKKSDCDTYQNDGFYELFIDGLLVVEEKNEIEEHLTSCHDCRVYFERMKNMEALLHQSLSQESIPDLEERMVHAFRKEVLMSYARWPPTELEQREQLEQLRLLDHGVNIRVVRTEHDSIGVDTPEELEQLERSLAGAGG